MKNKSKKHQGKKDPGKKDPGKKDPGKKDQGKTRSNTTKLSDNVKHANTSISHISKMSERTYEFPKYVNHGLIGLANLGNTCFINSTLQILSHCYELNDFLDTDYTSKLNNKYDSILLVEYDRLRKMLWNSEQRQGNYIVPDKFIQTLHKLARIKKMELFTGFSQNDMPEFLIFLIDTFHESLAREVTMTISGSAINPKDCVAIKCYEMVKQMYSKSYSEIWKLFYGIQVSKIVCLETNAELSINTEPFFMMNLSIPHGVKSPTLLDCLKEYVKGEVLEGENAWYNEKTTKKQSVNKLLQFWSLPKILVIDLKRINKYNFHNKNQILVDFPLENLNLSEFVEGYKKDSYVYDLFGVANHYGGTQGGHYTAFVKNANENWYMFNDTNVTMMKDKKNIITPHAYCFFYRKKTNQ